MKIACVYKAVYPPVSGGSGADRRVRDMMRGLVHAGHEVNMFVPKRDAGETTLNIDDMQVRYIGDSANGQHSTMKTRKSYWNALKAAVLNEGFDCLILYSVQIDGYFPARYLRKKGVKIAAEFCDLRSSGFETNSLRQRLRQFILRLDEALIPRVTDLNIVISQYLEKHCTDRAPNTPVIRMPVLVDSGLFKTSKAAANKVSAAWDIPDDAVVFSYVGGLWKSEGVGTLVNAFAQVVKEHPQSRLIIAGRLTKSDDHDDIEGMVDTLGLEGKVITPGWVSTDVVVGIYSRSDAVVLPQLNDQFAVAALPTKLAEYSHMKKAIIATRVGDIPQYFTSGKDILLVESENVDEVAQAMKTLITDKNLRRTLADGASRVAQENFDYRRAGERLSNALLAAV